jgi:hypothetical protein
LSVPFFSSLTASRELSPIGTIWSSSPCSTSVGTRIADGRVSVFPCFRVSVDADARGRRTGAVETISVRLFGTSLASTLHAAGVDTLRITGFSTLGCIRATALDALCHGFAPFVIRDACGDRDARPHEQNLFDMAAKMAEVITEAEAIALLERSGR